jgi:hypothetical protein
MPAIELIPVRLYQPTDPYNHQVDNIPIQALIERILLVNSQVDVDALVLTNAQGTAGNLANRLAQALNADGTLKTSAVDETEHNIARHTDGSIVVNGTTISYVRMLLDERAKLSGIASGSNKLFVKFDLNNPVPSGLPSQISVINISEIQFTNGEMAIKPSDSVYWSIDTDGTIKANTTFPATVRHLHHYDLVPVHQNLTSPDYKNYAVTSTNTAYKSGSLRVYINGIRLTQLGNVTPGKAPRGNYVPTAFSAATPTWLTYTYSEDTESSGVVTSGKFSLSNPITANDVITVDFDTLYVG